MRLGGVAKILRALRLHGAGDSLLLNYASILLARQSLLPSIQSQPPAVKAIAVGVLADALQPHLSGRISHLSACTRLILRLVLGGPRELCSTSVFPVMVEAVSVFSQRTAADDDEGGTEVQTGQHLEVALAVLAHLSKLAEAEGDVSGVVFLDPTLALLREEAHPPRGNIATLLACAILCNVCVYPGSAAVVRQRGGAALLVAALRRFEDDYVICEIVVKTLNNLAQAEGAEVEVGASGAVDAVLAAARAHPGTPAMSLVVTSALRSLAAGADNRRAIVEGGGVALLVELLGSHSGDAVEVHAVIVLELLSAGGLMGSGFMTGELRRRMDAALTQVICEGEGALARLVATTTFGWERYPGSLVKFY